MNSMKSKETYIREQLKKEIELPEIVNQKVEEAYDKIRGGEIAREKALPGQNRWMRRAVKLAGGMAAMLVLACMFALVNPVKARELPVVGSIFERLQNEVSFFGNFSDKAADLGAAEGEKLTEPGVEGEKSEDPVYTKQADGLTITISEIYANDQAIYLTMAAESEEPFPETMVVENADSSKNGMPVIEAQICTSYSFLADDAGEDMAFYYPEGTFIDEYTYVCILRLDLAEKAKDYTEYNERYDAMVAQVESELGISMNDLSDETEEGARKLEQFNDLVMERAGALRSYIKEIPVPEEFRIQLNIKEIMGFKANPEITTEALPRPNEKEHYWYTGDWSFDIPISVDNSQTVTLEINETNEAGIGLSKVVKTPYEITIHELYEEGANSDTFLVALDADGNKLPYNDSNANTNNFAIQDRDISTVDIYILDYMQYMDELKGPENYNGNESKEEGKKWGDLLAANAKYHKTVHFE